MREAALSSQHDAASAVSKPKFATGSTVLLLPLALYLAVFLLWPMFKIVMMSFYRADPTQLWVEAFQLGNYSRLFVDGFYLNVLLRTFRVAVVSTLICILLAYPVAYSLARTRSRFRGVLILLVFTPLLVSVVIRSYGWMVLLGDEGVINTLWKLLPFSTGPLPLMLHEHSVVIGLTQVLLPFMIIPLMSAIQNIDPAQEQAAISLGAGPIRTFLAIIVPLSMPGLVSGVLLVFTTGMSAFSIPMFLGGPSQMSMAVLIYQQMLFTFNWPLGSAVGVVLLIITTVAILLSLIIASKLASRN
jgi:putative spermidine/putrescine transport system permease protein